MPNETKVRFVLDLADGMDSSHYEYDIEEFFGRERSSLITGTLKYCFNDKDTYQYERI